MRTLNLGILAHIDAGKTSLTERLLFSAGATDQIGSVDQGNTITDSLDQERQRGITIKSAVASFAIDDILINVIDTPGHPDFIAEIERVLDVLDGAILAISAVEGVQAQTRVLMRTLRRLKIPTLIFVNKVDRSGAEYRSTLDRIRQRLTSDVVPMGVVSSIGTPGAQFNQSDMDDVSYRSRVLETLAENNDELISVFLDDINNVTRSFLEEELVSQSKSGLIHPIFFGSAITGAGIEALRNGIAGLLPVADCVAQAPVSGRVFKIERGHRGEKTSFVRLFSGTIKLRDRLKVRGRDQTVTAIQVFQQGAAKSSPSMVAGQIGKLTGLNDVRIGDTIGVTPKKSVSSNFALPTLETALTADIADEKSSLHAALKQIAEQDPLINLRQDDIRQEIFLSLYGEVQKEVIRDTLKDDYGIEASFSETTTICVERPLAIGSAVERAPNPFVATVGIRVEPAPATSGIQFELEVEYGSLPTSFLRAVEESVYETLQQGLLGWQVIGCKVVMTETIRLRDWATSTAAEHRNLTPLVVMSALKMAKTEVLEPIHRFHLEAPSDSIGAIFPVLTSIGAIPETPEIRGEQTVLTGSIPAARVQEVQRRLPGLTHGEGFLESVFQSYQPVTGEVQVRPRSDMNPLNRKEYLRQLSSRN